MYSYVLKMRIIKYENSVQVAELNFWDVVLDFILIDAFEDVSHPPSAVLAVAKNRFLSDSIKQSTLSTVIWSMLKAKRQRLLVKGFYCLPSMPVASIIDMCRIISV